MLTQFCSVCLWVEEVDNFPISGFKIEEGVKLSKLFDNMLTFNDGRKLDYCHKSTENNIGLIVHCNE